jgi:glycosyltransferase involved in cell wall biosynthesis
MDGQKAVGGDKKGLPTMTKRALLISPVRPVATGTGREKRAHLWLWTLSQTHTVDVWVIPRRRFPMLMRLLQRMLPWPMWRSLAPSDWCRPLESDQPPFPAGWDRIVCFRLYLAEFATRASQQFEIDLDDVESLTRRSIARLHADTGEWMAAWAELQNAKRYADYERHWLPKATRVYVANKEDVQGLAYRFPSLPIETFANRLQRSLMPKTVCPPPNSGSILFVGSLDYPPNRQAVLWFATHVLPRLQHECGSLSFIVAGRGEMKPLSDILKGREGITLLGEVDNLIPLYQKSRMVVAPLRAGGGTKLKTLEALANGRPLVASPEAVRGLDLIAGQDYLLASSAEEFALQCQNLVVNHDRARTIAISGRKKAEQHFLYGHHV